MHFRDELVVYADIAVRRPANHELLLLVLAHNNVGILKIVGRENLQFKLKRKAVPIAIVLHGLVLFSRDQVRYDIRLADVDQEAVTNDNCPVQLREGAVSLTEILNLVLLVDRVELNVELPALMVIC